MWLECLFPCIIDANVRGVKRYYIVAYSGRQLIVGGCLDDEPYTICLPKLSCSPNGRWWGSHLIPCFCLGVGLVRPPSAATLLTFDLGARVLVTAAR